MDNKNPYLNMGFYVKIIFKVIHIKSNKDNEYILNNIIIVKSGLSDKIIDKHKFVNNCPLIKSLYISYSADFLNSHFLPICNDLEALTDLDIPENNNNLLTDSNYLRNQNNSDDSSRNIIDFSDSIANTNLMEYKTSIHKQQILLQKKTENLHI